MRGNKSSMRDSMRGIRRVVQIGTAMRRMRIRMRIGIRIRRINVNEDE